MRLQRVGFKTVIGFASKVDFSGHEFCVSLCDFELNTDQNTFRRELNVTLRQSDSDTESLVTFELGFFIPTLVVWHDAVR